MASLSARVAERMTVSREVTRAADPVTLEEFGYLLGRSRGGAFRTKSGITVGTNRALGITAWWRGVRYLSETVASLPVHTYRDGRYGRSRRADPSWLRKPDVEQTWFGLVECWMMSMLHRGNAFAFKLRDPVGRVMGLRELHPDRVTFGQAPDGTKRFRVDQLDVEFTTRDVFHVPSLAYHDGRVGINPLRAMAESLGVVAAGEDYAQRFFGQGTHVGGYISVPQKLNRDQAEELREEWDRFHKGLAEAHQTGVLSQGGSYESIGLNASDAQLLESRKFGVTEVARALGVVPHKLYDLERSTFSNIESQAIESVIDSIRPWVKRIEDWVNDDRDLVPSGNKIEFQLEGLLRGDSAARAAFYQALIQNGVMMPSEVRRLENLDPVDGAEYLLRPLNMAVVSPGGDETLGGDEAPALRRALLGLLGEAHRNGATPEPVR